MSPFNRPSIICLGEILWDCLPAGLFMGGAPTNVAYHLALHGCDPLIVSAVGADFLGDEVRRRVAGWGLTTDFLATIADAPTGTVQVDASVPTNPVYTIVENVAWDRIPASDALIDAAPACAALVFGTLSMREANNRRSLDSVLSVFKGLRVLDINLRPPFDRPDSIEFAASRADLLKLNDVEVVHDIPGAGRPDPASLHEHAARWARRCGLKSVCVTAGERGAGLLWEGEWHWQAGRPVEVKDTVGSGDAFLAALLASLLGGRLPADALARACRTGELVASRSGGTPVYDVRQIDDEAAR
ncbi:MAG: PfkB family carbohydrate kinase [Capsulimonadaceae bacterium]|nr:PfkB family carbohydrate kinase [Capsulimonadaceae bacterium]